MIDATHEISPEIQTYPAPWHVSVAFEQTADLVPQGRRASRIVIGSHTGTHVDAPSHFVDGGATIDEFPIELSCGPAEVVDFRPLLETREVTLEKFLEAMDGRSPALRMLLVFGWSGNFGTPGFYSDSPYVAEEVAQYLVDGGVRLLAYDTASLDSPIHGSGCSIDSPVHKILLSAGLWLAEYVNVPPEIQLPRSVDFTVAPLPLRGVDGSPTRCILRP
jgi:kynurenine formamidase